MKTLAKILLCGATLAMLASCGSTPSAQADIAPAADNAAPALPSGPFDSSHKDDAIAVAVAAARKSRGHPSVANPQAFFQPLYPGPQVPGQPLATPRYGWLIGFDAVFHDADDGPATADPAAQPHMVGTSIPLLAAQGSSQNRPAISDPLATASSHPQPYQQPGTARPVDGTVADPSQAPLNITHPDSSPNPGTMFQSASTMPQMGPGSALRRTGTMHVFVAIDGTIAILPQ